MTFHSPTSSVVGVGLTCHLRKSYKYDGNKEAVKQSSDTQKGHPGYTEDEIVSYDFNSDTHSFTLNPGVGIAFHLHTVKLTSWYDNEFGYRKRVVDIMVPQAFKE
ncbi:glyceraldehyde-3-phosphate dehydrogenase-like [Sciurus carolinensis]|uniref:glyceraldehyde-3-phosphate dehydrogenase-like n=1 Tax=Sciurus carolinensis TaxID=30640 RepID=UPI001FB21CED|nr:glyceraldehyde-3-phosphate dehydrogenase-like [Sciurus carolinensis]